MVYGKRLVKSPKLYFVYTGLATLLLGIRTAEELFVHPNRGNIFESFVVSGFLKARCNQGFTPDIYFWRDNVGTEVDVVYEGGPKLKAIEIKSGKTFDPEFAKGLESWMRYSRTAPADCALAYAGEQSMKWKDLPLVPWAFVGGLVK